MAAGNGCDDSSQVGVAFGETIQRGVEFERLVGGRRAEILRVDLAMLDAAAALVATAAARMIERDLAHRARGEREEVPAILDVPDAAIASAFPI